MTHALSIKSFDHGQKKAAIAGAMDFMDANRLEYSKYKLFAHFGISATTGYAWFPVPEATGPRRGRPKAGTIKAAGGSSGKKRSRREDPDDDGVGDSFALTMTPVRQNQPYSDGNGQKKLKTAVRGQDGEMNSSINATTPPTFPQSAVGDALSPTPPPQLLTPPTRGRGRPKKQPGSNSKEKDSLKSLKEEEMDVHTLYGF